MARTFNLAAVGDTMTEGDIIEWFVAVGEYVAVDQPICSIETDKSVIELTSPFAGVVLRLGAEAGATLAVGEALLVVGTEGEQSADQQEAPAVPPCEKAVGSTVLGPLVRALVERHGIDPAQLCGTGPGGRITRDDVLSHLSDSQQPPPAKNGSTDRPPLAMPRVRRAARERSLSLLDIVGTGPRGSITMTDLDDASNITQAPPVPTHAEERRPLTRMRRTIADNLTKRWQEVPHVTGHSDADASPLIELRNELSRAWDEKVPVDALMIALSTIALRDFPTFRARVDGNEVVVANRYDIGVAVDTDDGLIVPVLRAVDAMSVREVAAQLRTVAAKARTRELGPNDLVGNVFTVSNLGPVGIGHATSITPEGTTALLSVGRSVASWTTGPDGSPNPTQRLPLSITVDHRAIDGADAGRFLSRVIDLIEHPVAALMA